mmetsp:Transcript_24711/g.40089  ORF Transcript_24711/g.40089 Transcript_24711/m.40089 type:complete len:240 (-) Transcript_24711:2951-3670(-)
MSDVTIGFIGAGQMSTAMMKGFIAAGVVKAENMFGTNRSQAGRDKVKAFGCTALDSNVELVKKCRVIFLGVKPYMIQDVLKEVKEHITDDKLIISIALGLRLETLQKWVSPSTRIIRVMPNTPCLVRQSACAYVPGEHATAADTALVDKLLSAVGLAIQVPENQLNAVTGLSGSGPAYVYLMIEGLADGGVRAGLRRDIALQLAAQTVKGAAEMVLMTGEHPGVLKDQVCSPGGKLSVC